MLSDHSSIKWFKSVAFKDGREVPYGHIKFADASWSSMILHLPLSIVYYKNMMNVLQKEHLIMTSLISSGILFLIGK